MTNAPWTHGPIPGVETPLATAPETLAAYARDFGGIVEATPAAVLRLATVRRSRPRSSTATNAASPPWPAPTDSRATASASAATRS